MKDRSHPQQKMAEYILRDFVITIGIPRRFSTAIVREFGKQQTGRAETEIRKKDQGQTWNWI